MNQTSDRMPPSASARRPLRHWWARSVLTATVAALAACSPDDSAGPDVQEVQLGALAIVVSNVPSGGQATVTISGPGGAHTVHSSGTVSGLKAGSYTVTAADIIVHGAVFTATPPSQTVTVTAGATTSVPGISWSLATGALTLDIDGLPAGTSALVVLTGPGGFSLTVDAGGTHTGLVPGVYTIDARRVQAGGFSYDAIVPLQTVTVAAMLTPSTAAVSYAVATGALSVVVGGLPGGTAGAVRVSGPEGYQVTVSASTTLSNLQPGTYTVTSEPVSVGADTWTGPPPQQVPVGASTTPSAATVTYGIATGRLTIQVAGYPAGSTPGVQVSGPDGFAATVLPGATLTGLVPGSYTIAAAAVSTGTATYAPMPAVQSVVVAASATPTVASVTYAIATGSLTVTIPGAPVAANVTVAGPGGYTVHLASSGTLSNLTPGAYTITGADVVSGPHRYAPTPPVQVVTVMASLTPATATVTYGLASGLVSLTISGLPPGAGANVTVTGPGGYHQAVGASTILTGLAPGPYTVTAGSVVVGGATWLASPSTQGVTVPASTMAVPVSVTYAQSVGFLAVNVTGLPAGAAAAVHVAGPGGYSAMLTASETLNLAVGTYTLTATAVSAGGVTYTPAPASQQATVLSGATSAAGVHYTGVAAGGLNLLIDGAYITQSVQTYNGSVPLVANRDGLLRVFVRASEPNSVQPAVRARFYHGASLVQTLTITAPSAAVPTSVNEGVLAASWNATVSGTLLQPGVSLLVDVDPAGAIGESSETDNVWPASGAPAPLDVRSVSTLGIRFVPIRQSVNNLTGNVSDANTATYLTPLERMLPVAGVDADVHATYTTSLPALTASGTTGWTNLLGEINALRVTEGSTRYYYGVVRVGYTSGIAGLGYIGWPAAMGWDHLPSGAEVMAHELGHNFGRWHAPCGGPSQVDANWPHATHPGAIVGHYGYDIVAGVLKPTTQFDLMSYCDPAWISDYTYKAILNYRLANPDVVSARIQPFPAGPARSLIVWGRIESGQVILEPAFETDAPASLPARAGPHRLEGLGVGGETLFWLSFEGDRIADTDSDDRLFAFAVPMSMLNGRSLATLRVTSGARRAERHAAAGAPAGVPVLTRLGARTRVSWPVTAAGALIRNARTGEVVAISRGPGVELPAGPDELDVVLSDGVRSTRTRVRPP